MQDVMGGEFRICDEYLTRGKRVPIDYSSGRCALFYILRQIEKAGIREKNILLPDFLCDSITKTVIAAGWKYRFYHINGELHFDLNEIVGNQFSDAILVINYFGMLHLDDEIIRIKENNPGIFVIEDDVQAFYSYKDTKADYSFTSIRKWLPCPDGGFVFPGDAVEKPRKSSKLWSYYKYAGNVLKNHPGHIAENVSLALIEKGERLLEKDYLTRCSTVSQKILPNIKLEEVAAKRRENARLLHDRLSEMGIPHTYSGEAVPLFIPIYVKNRDALRRAFFENKIFTPVHWPKSSDELNGNNELYNTELSLICDQRYGLEDIERELFVLQMFYGG